VRQTRLESLLEQTCNIGSGFIIALLTWKYVCAPLIDIGILDVHDAFEITCIFTVISFIRGYYWRRFFNAGVHRVIHEFVQKIYA
jgi:hypothetical protein